MATISRRSKHYCCPTRSVQPTRQTEKVEPACSGHARQRNYLRSRLSERVGKTIKWVVGGELSGPPHPSPLPWGEGESSAGFQHNPARVLLRTVESSSPSIHWWTDYDVPHPGLLRYSRS